MLRATGAINSKRGSAAIFSARYAACAQFLAIGAPRRCVQKPAIWDQTFSARKPRDSSGPYSTGQGLPAARLRAAALR